MKIYGSTEYFDRDKQTETYYQLHVTSQWDFSMKSICYKNLPDGTLIGYNLRQGNPYKQITLEEVTDEMRENLEGRGYRMADKK
jgi:hypothetical protein